jgi:hypothetical protein
MDFLIYLLPETKDVYDLVSKKVRFVENSELCRKYDIYGMYQSDTNKFIICTQRIVNGPDVKYYINETVLHEAVHVAQSCKTRNRTVSPLGISPYDMPLSNRRANDLKKAIRMSGEVTKNIEHEAFWMEDKPNKVKYVLEKYCF